jgi:hypothetical protein
MIFIVIIYYSLPKKSKNQKDMIDLIRFWVVGYSVGI